MTKTEQNAAPREISAAEMKQVAGSGKRASPLPVLLVIADNNIGDRY